MNALWKRPQVGQTKVEDRFWTPYLKNIRTKTLPYVFDKFEEVGYIENFRSVARRDGMKHRGSSFSDGLVTETMRAAFDFLADSYDPELDARMDELVDLICAAAQEDGYICTMTCQNYPTMRWGENGGDIVYSHDLYDIGAVVDAAISQYLATGKTKLLGCAVKAATLVCSYMGPGKHNIIPGHSLPEEAFVKLYRLFRDHRELDQFARDYMLRYGWTKEFLKIAEYWYDNRGNYEGRSLSGDFSRKYNQDHLPFAQQRTAEGHAVRATLCYTGAAAVAYETGREDLKCALDAIWENTTQKKLHISGGIGTRHDIEGFDEDYNLPNNAYLETCAAIGNAFWNGEMSLLDSNGKYFDYFEQSLYNNVLAAIADDFVHYTYQNPLVSDGTVRRWSWHGTPCCPPMLAKLYSSLNSYIYSYREDAVSVNLYIGSTLDLEQFKIVQQEKQFRVDSRGKEMTLRFRVPNYAENFGLSCNGKALDVTVENGYAAVSGVWTEADVLTVSFEEPVRRIFANPAVQADRGMVAVMRGPFLLCAEGIDNGGKVDFTLAADPKLQADGDGAVGVAEDGKPIRLIPYYRWCNRIVDEENDSKMAVWFRQADMPAAEVLNAKLNGALYGVY